jgi:uncharacterized protein YbjT (DUF2867 family)
VRERRLFVAGATGAVGREVMRQAKVPAVAHVRPAKRGTFPGEAAFELEDRAALERALAGCTTVLQLIGTVRSRFAAGDTYESSDVGTTRLLAAAASAAGVDHLVLLSSVGAGKPVGAYLQAKARAEAIVRESGVPYTIFRPSMFVGEGRRPPPLWGAITGALGLDRYRPIEVSELAAKLLRCAGARAPLGAALEGRPLWDV